MSQKPPPNVAPRGACAGAQDDRGPWWSEAGAGVLVGVTFGASATGKLDPPPAALNNGSRLNAVATTRMPLHVGARLGESHSRRPRDGQGGCGGQQSDAIPAGEHTRETLGIRENASGRKTQQLDSVTIIATGG